jgi:hypothetical protein
MNPPPASFRSLEGLSSVRSQQDVEPLLLKNGTDKAAVNFFIFRQQNGLPLGINSFHFCLVSALKEQINRHRYIFDAFGGVAL